MKTPSDTASSVPPQKKIMVVFETPLSNSYGNINSQPENEKQPTNYVQTNTKTKLIVYVLFARSNAYFKLLRKTLIPPPKNNRRIL
jgi:hypothetical protein